MPIILSAKEVEEQSNQVFNQFGEKWIRQAKINVRLPHRNAKELMNIGVGKFLVCAAMGESLEKNIDILRKYRRRYDIVTCDKGFGMLLEQGIKADYVMICDSNILTKWIDPYWDDTVGVKLICTPYSNIEWTMQWKGDLYFYISRDAIKTEKIFLDIFGEEIHIIPASSNVSNTMIVLFLSIDEKSRANFAGYEKYILVGYDYGWRIDGKYYAFSDPKPKRYYMNHCTFLDIENEPFLSSENLLFSAKWLYSYLTTIKMPVINCSGRGLLDIPDRSDLEKELSRINPDKDIGKRLLTFYDEITNMNIIYDKAIKDFNKMRGGLALW